MGCADGCRLHLFTCGCFVCLVFVFMIRSDFSNRILLEPCSRKASCWDDDSVHFFPYLKTIGSDSFLVVLVIKEFTCQRRRKRGFDP